ncbi:NADPH oxidase organizer 1-like [Pelodytes ibericus]
MPQRTRSGSDRHPLEAKAVGVLQHGKLKHNMLSIIWSDCNDILIYRTFEDFKRLHRDLRKRFPLEAGFFRKSEKIIPKFKDVPVFRLNRTTNRFIERLRLLENYSQELMKTDEKISRCEVILQFFSPKSHDLNPTFPENSLVIMPPEPWEVRRELVPSIPKPPANGPIISQQYLCIEDYETKDTKNRPFKVKRNEPLGVLVKESSGWWLVENEEKRVAWFPAPYLKDAENNEDASSGSDSDYDGILYYASRGYEAMSSDELSMSIGIIVEVREKSNNGWWLVRYNGKAGYVPSMYLKPYSTYQQLQSRINQGKFASTTNLFKASSSLALNTVTEEWRSRETPPADLSDSHNKKAGMNLNRKKSRSLCGLSSNMQRELANSPTKYGDLALPSSTDQKPVPKQRKNGVPTPQYEPAERNIIPSKPLNNRLGADSNKTITSTITSLPQTGTPQVPKRPNKQEILHKCTSVTKNALLV